MNPLDILNLSPPDEYSQEKRCTIREVVPITWRTLQVNSELEQFQRLIADVPINIVLEIGVAKGGTAALWALMVPSNGRVIGITLEFLLSDGRTGIINKVYDGVKEIEGKVTLVVGDSHDPNAPWAVEKTLRGEKVDLLFIDGDHKVEGAEQDFIVYKEFVREGGIIALHDIASLLPDLWNHIINIYPLSWEIVHVEGRVNNGIGVIRMDSKIEYTPKFYKEE